MAERPPSTPAGADVCLLPDVAAVAHDELMRHATLLTVPRNTALFSAGEALTRLFVVRTGKVKITRRSQHSVEPVATLTRSGGRYRAVTTGGSVRESLLWVMGPGDLFGEGALAGATSADQATALVDSSVWALPATDLAAAMGTHADVAMAVGRRLAERLMAADDRISGLALGDVPSRLAQVLLWLADRFGDHHGSTITVRHDLTQGEIAQIVGASRETVNKALTDFVHRGWVKLDPRVMVVLEPGKLRARTD